MMTIFSHSHRMNIVSYLLNRGYDLNTYSLNSLIDYDIRNYDSIQKMIRITLSDNVPFEINGHKSVMYKQMNYILNISIRDIIDEIIKSNDDPEKKNLIKDLKKELKECIPSALYPELIDNKLMSKHSYLKISEITDKIYPDERSSVLFMDDMKIVNAVLANELSSKCNVDALLNNVNLTIRLYIPKEYFIICSKYINENTIIYKKPLQLNGHLVYENLIPNKKDSDFNTSELFKSMTETSTILYSHTGDESSLLSNTIYNVIINASISDWRNIISTLSEIDKESSHSVVSSIPLFIKSFKYSTIYNLIGGDNNNGI